MGGTTAISTTCTYTDKITNILRPTFSVHAYHGPHVKKVTTTHLISSLKSIHLDTIYTGAGIENKMRFLMES